MLQHRLTLQQQAVGQYARALTAADAKLQECVTRQSDYAQRLTDAKSAQEALKAQVAAAAQQVRTFSATLGESDSATISAKANLDALKTEYRASVQEVKKLAGQNTALSKSAQNAADTVSAANTNLNNARAAVRNTQAELTKCNQALALAQTRWDEAGKAIDDSRAAITTFRQADIAGRKPIQAGDCGHKGAGYQRHRADRKTDAADRKAEHTATKFGAVRGCT